MLKNNRPLVIFFLLATILLGNCQTSTLKQATPTGSATSIPTSTVTPTPLVTSTATLSPTPSLLGCPEIQGKFQRLTLEDKVLGKPLQVIIFTPPCYDSKKTGEYPLLVLLHGQGYTAQQWIDLGVAETASRLMASGELPPFLIALPQEDYFLLDITKSAFGPAVIKTLIPRVRQEYATCSTRQCTAIGGISRGAVWAVYLGFNNGLEFGSIGVHSMPSNPFPEYYMKDLLLPLPEKPRMYLDSGSSDRYLPDAKRFESALTAIHLPHSWIMRNGEHNDAYWRSHVEEYLRWYAAPWKSPRIQ